MTQKFRATQIKGKLYLFRDKEFADYLRTLGDKVLDVVVKAHRNSRSDRQNKYFHGIVLQILSEHTGYTVEEMKDLCKTMFLKSYITVGGKERLVVRGSSELDTKSFEEFMENIRRWAATELAISIPTPNEVDL